MIVRYNGFKLERLKFEVFSILEGYIKSTNDFLMKLKDLKNQPGKVGVIADRIMSTIEDERWFSDKEIKQNYFDLVDSEDMVSFIDNKKVVDKEDEIGDDHDYPYAMSGRGEIKIGRVVNYICSLTNLIITDKDREDFVNAWKASTNITTIQFKLVSGDDIAKYYSVDKYYNKNGSLGGSCMRDESNSFFKIYTENPDKVKMLIYVDSDDRIHGRALVWKVKKSPCDSKYFMDRVYTNRDSDINRFKQFADNEGWFYKKNISSYDANGVTFMYGGKEVAGEIKLKLEGKFRKYPYLDTLCYLSKDRDSLSNLSSKYCYILRDVYGDKEECYECDGEILTEDWDGNKVLCSECSSGHLSLKMMGIETKLNKKVD